MTEGEKIVELEQRIKFLEKVVYGAISMIALELVGLFVLWAKDVLSK